MHESFVHDSLKSSLAFRKPATAVASRRLGRADGLMVGLDGHASLSAGRAPTSVWRDGQEAGLLFQRRDTVRTCVLTLISGAVRTRQHLSQELLVHCVNTCLRRCWYTVSTPVLAFEHPCLASKSGCLALFQHVAKAAFTQSPNSCKKRHFLCCKNFVVIFPFFSYFFCFGPLRGIL